MLAALGEGGERDDFTAHKDTCGVAPATSYNVQSKEDSITLGEWTKGSEVF
jgi:hypothetical protein